MVSQLFLSCSRYGLHSPHFSLKTDVELHLQKSESSTFQPDPLLPRKPQYLYRKVPGKPLIIDRFVRVQVLQSELQLASPSQ